MKRGSCESQNGMVLLAGGGVMVIIPAAGAVTAAEMVRGMVVVVGCMEQQFSGGCRPVVRYARSC